MDEIKISIFEYSSVMEELKQKVAALNDADLTYIDDAGSIWAMAETDAPAFHLFFKR